MRDFLWLADVVFDFIRMHVIQANIIFILYKYIRNLLLKLQLSHCWTRSRLAIRRIYIADAILLFVNVHLEIPSLVNSLATQS